MPAWVIWALVALGLAVGEIFTPGLFFLGPVALAAVLAGILALAGAGAVVQLIVFIVAAIASVAFIRPIAKAHLRVPTSLRTGTAALAGTKGEFSQALGQLGSMLQGGNSEPKK